MSTSLRWLQLVQLTKGQFAALKLQLPFLIGVGILTLTVFPNQALATQQCIETINLTPTKINLLGVVLSLGFVSAVLALMAYLVRQQQQTRAVNQEQAALQKANQELEIRVQELTQELVASQVALLQKQTHFLQTVLDSMGDGVVVCDLEGKFLVFNPAAEKILGMGATDISPAAWTQTYGIYLPDQVTPYPTEYLPLMRACLGEAQDHVEIFFCNAARPEGVTVDACIRPLKDQAGVVQAGMIVLHDISERKAAEKALLSSEERFYRAVINAPIPAMIHAEGGEVLQINQVWTDLTGYAYSDIPTIADWNQRAYGQTRKVPTADMESLYHQETKVEEGEYSVTTSSGETRIWDFCTAPLGQLPDGRRLLMSMARDVTARKQTELALRHSEQRYRFLVEGTAQTIWTANAQGELLTARSSWHTLTGTAQNEENFKSWKWLNFIHPDDHEGVIQVWTQAVETKKFCEIEFRAWATDERYRDFFVRGVPILNADGDVREWIGTCIDITERKQIEAELRVSEERFRTSVENLLDCFGIFTSIRDQFGRILDFRIEYLNPAACINNLMTKEEQIGKGLCELLPAHREIGLFDEYCQVIETGEPLVKESLVYEDVFKQQRISRAFDLSVTKLGDGFVVSWRDISMRKRAEEELFKALARERELNEFRARIISVISHEYRTPLTTIQMSVGLLENYNHKLTEAKKLTHFQRIQTAVNHLTQLVSDVLIIGEAEVGKLTVKPVPLNVAKFCGDLVEELQVNAGSNHILTFSSKGCCTTAFLDERLLRQIFTNLLTNAIKYSPQDSKVIFELTCGPKNAVFRVQDQGIGIPVADQMKLFEAFHRATNVGTISGTGLGLSIVKKAVEIQGGKITFVSETGIGTTFTVTLPLNNHISTDEKAPSS